MMRYSINRQMLANWIPQVLVKFWVMTHCYIRDHEERSPGPVGRYGFMAVRESLDVLRKDGFKPMQIYSTKGAPPVPITVADLNALADQLNGRLARR